MWSDDVERQLHFSVKALNCRFTQSMVFLFECNTAKYGFLILEVFLIFLSKFSQTRRSSVKRTSSGVT